MAALLATRVRHHEIERLFRRGFSAIEAGAIAHAFHTSIVDAIVRVHNELGEGRPLAASGGVFQNRLLVDSLHARLGTALWVNRVVPANDGGLCLGQAALAASGLIQQPRSGAVRKNLLGRLE